MLRYWGTNLPGVIPETAGTALGLASGALGALSGPSDAQPRQLNPGSMRSPSEEWARLKDHILRGAAEGYQQGFSFVPGAEWAKQRREAAASQLSEGQGELLDWMQPMPPVGKVAAASKLAAIPMLGRVRAKRIPKVAERVAAMREMDAASAAAREAGPTVGEMEAGVAEAMKSAPPVPKMAPAMRHPQTGEILTKRGAATHMDVLGRDQYGLPFEDDDFGFISPDGRYLSRKEATEYIRTGGLPFGEDEVWLDPRWIDDVPGTTTGAYGKGRAGTASRGYEEVPDVLRGHRERAALSPLGYTQVYPEVMAAAHERVKPELRRYLTPAQPRAMREAGEVAYSDADTTSGFSLGILRDEKGKVTSVDLRKVWNSGGRGQGTEAINAALARAANLVTQQGVKGAKITLDAFDADGGKLLDKYREMGFVETGRDKYDPQYDTEKLWAKEKPDVVYMALEPKQVPLLYRRALEAQQVAAPRAGRQGVKPRRPRAPVENTAKRPKGYAPEVAMMESRAAYPLSPTPTLVEGPRGETLSASRQGEFPDVYPRKQAPLIDPATGGGVTDPRTWEQNPRVIAQEAERERIGELFPYATQRAGVGGGTEFELPKKQETIDRRVAATDERLREHSPEWLRSIERGRRMGGEGWYYQPQFWDALVEALGSPEEAAKAMNLNSALMGVTSPGVDPVMNSMRADMLTGMITGGHDVTQMDPKKLKIAGRYGWQGVRDSARKMQELYERGEDPFLAYGPRTKTAQYARAIAGELSGVPIDVHMARGVLGYPNIPGEAPQIHPVEAMRAEELIARTARREGQAPSSFMAQGWMGSGVRTGMENPQLLQQSHQEALLLGAARWGMEPKDYFRRLFTGDIPLSQFRALLPAGVGLAATLDWLREQQELQGAEAQ